MASAWLRRNVVVMLNKSDFFQEQIKKCNGLAERASSKTDREFEYP
jgi:hypothetical protein